MMLRFKVNDRSMLPAFREGDYVLVRPYFLSSPREGDVVVAEVEGRFILKRVSSFQEGMVFLEGDNKAYSRDSRHLGPVPVKAVRGKVWFRSRE